MGDIRDEDGARPGSGRSTNVVGTLPADWLRGRHRGLLNPGSVGTVDQLLVAGTLSKYVSMRHAGMAGKVIVIDEVHAYDVFMAEYLHAVLRWCGAGGIPVILMSATLPPAMRRALVESYVQGGDPSATAAIGSALSAPGAYPRITSWSATGDLRTSSCLPARPTAAVRVEVDESEDWDDAERVAQLALQEVANGGCALVIVNTVRRAQDVYTALTQWGIPTEILHSRLTTSQRAERAFGLLNMLGPDSSVGNGRPGQLVVVATQVAEQSFDVDADVLISDIAPVDLLLQRIGRLHRHASHNPGRPANLSAPRTIVTGCTFSENGPPRFVRAFQYVYDRWSLMRTAQLLATPNTVWSIPDDIPPLVAAGYDEAGSWPASWSDDADAALDDAKAKEKARQAAAGLGVLEMPRTNHLTGLHSRPAPRTADRVAVRDGEPTREVVMVKRTAGGLVSMTGIPLGAEGELARDQDTALALIGDSVRVRESEDLGPLGPLPGWAGVPLLARQDALVLDAGGRANGEWGSVVYDPQLGLRITRNFARRR